MAQFLNWMLRTCTVLKPIDQIVKWCCTFIELGSTQEGSNEVIGLVCEELLSIVYLCWLWLGSGAPTLGMKFLGREPNTRLYDVASAICASQGEAAVVRCLLEGVEPTSVWTSRINKCRKKEEVYVMVTVRLCQRHSRRKALKLNA